jgi:hypothetical protein
MVVLKCTGVPYMYLEDMRTTETSVIIAVLLAEF